MKQQNILKTRVGGVVLLAFLTFGCKDDTPAKIDLTRDLLAYYPLNGNVLDESGNARDGNGTNVQFGTDINESPEKACTFSGEGSYLELPNVLNITEKVWSYSIWFKLNDLESGTAPVLLGTRLSANTFWDIPLYIRSSIKAVATYNETVFGIPDEISLSKWYHVVLVIDDGKINMYLNGELKSSKTGFISQQSNSGYQDFNGDPLGSYEFYTGKYYVSEKFRGESFPSYLKGSVDNIRFYGRALSELDVKELYVSKQ
jgi:Concanavalin A-like lectin/glucanases superfamily